MKVLAIMGNSNINELWGAFAFHAISMILGTACAARSMKSKKLKPSQHV